MTSQRLPLLALFLAGCHGASSDNRRLPGGEGVAQSGSLDVIPHGLSEGGTTAALCTDRSGKTTFLLTCGHVFLGVPANLLGQIDLCLGTGTLPKHGRVGECSPTSSGSITAVDAALVEVAPETARTLAYEYATLTPRTYGSSGLLPDQSLLVHTRRGRVRGILVRQQPNFPVKASSGYYTLSSVYCYCTEEPTEPGDSGAAVWDDQGRLVGIHCGAFADTRRPAGNAFFCDIDAVVEAFRIRIVTREAGTDPGKRVPPLIETRAVPEVQSADELDVVARTIWGEAGDRGKEAMRAVAAVILKRRTHGKWWGTSATEVCLRPYQFSCWDAASPASQHLRSLDANDPVLQEARSLAEAALDPNRGIAPDPSRGATRYHPEWLVPVPDWARGREPCDKIGGLWFYNDID